MKVAYEMDDVAQNTDLFGENEWQAQKLVTLAETSVVAWSVDSLWSYEPQAGCWRKSTSGTQAASMSGFRTTQTIV